MACREHLDIEDNGRARALVASFDQGADGHFWTDKQPLDATVSTIAHPALDPQIVSRGHGPTTKPNTLNAAEDVYANCPLAGLGHRSAGEAGDEVAGHHCRADDAGDIGAHGMHQ